MDHLFVGVTGRFVQERSEGGGERGEGRREMKTDEDDRCEQGATIAI